MTLIARRGYQIADYCVTPTGRLSVLWRGARPGRWSARFDGQITSRPFVPHRGDLQLRMLKSQ